VLGDDSGSRLYWELVDSGVAEHASLHHHDFLDAGLFATQLSCDAEDAEPLMAEILNVYRTAATGGISRDEWERARNKLSSRVVLAGERPRRRLFSVGLEWAHERTYRSVADDLRIVESITLDGLHDVLARWPLDGPAATVFAGPGEASISGSAKPH
jgi:predicted Zn-dependent peptidase